MSTIVKIQKKGQVVIPRRLREQVGVAEGDLLEVEVQGSHFLLTPKLIVSRDLSTTSNSGKQQREQVVAEVRASAPQALRDIWAESERKGLDKMTARQIDALIKEARQEQALRNKIKQPVK